jgi:hypothetical protein
MGFSTVIYAEMSPRMNADVALICEHPRHPRINIHDYCLTVFSAAISNATTSCGTGA